MRPGIASARGCGRRLRVDGWAPDRDRNGVLLFLDSISRKSYAYPTYLRNTNEILTGRL
jgi:hypothetical protein